MTKIYLNERMKKVLLGIFSIPLISLVIVGCAPATQQNLYRELTLEGCLPSGFAQLEGTPGTQRFFGQDAKVDYGEIWIKGTNPDIMVVLARGTGYYLGSGVTLDELVDSTADEDAVLDSGYLKDWNGFYVYWFAPSSEPRPYMNNVIIPDGSKMIDLSCLSREQFDLVSVAEKMMNGCEKRAK